MCRRAYQSVPTPQTELRVRWGHLSSGDGSTGRGEKEMHDEKERLGRNRHSGALSCSARRRGYDGDRFSLA